MFIYRTAKLSDASVLSQIHYDCCKKQPGGFMFQFGKPAIFNYYKLLLQEKHSLILIAEDEEGNVVGFVSGTTNAAEHLKNLKILSSTQD